MTAPKAHWCAGRERRMTSSPMGRCTSEWRSGAARRSDRRRPLPHPRWTVLLDAARRPRGDRDQGREPCRRRHADVDATRQRWGVHVLPVDRPQQALDRARLHRSRRPCSGSRAVAEGRRSDRELQARRPRQVRSRLRDGPPGQPTAGVPVDQRVRHVRRSVAPRVRPHRPSRLRLDEPHRRGRGTGVPRRDRGVRRDDRLARADRRARRPAPAHRDGARAARRGQPAVLGDVRTRQPDGGLHGGRRRPDADGQCPSELVPLRDDADRRPRRHHHRRQRRPVPGALRGARDRRGRRRPALRLERRPHRQPRGAAPPAARAARRHGRPPTSSSPSTRQVSRAGRSTPSPRASSWRSRSGWPRESRWATAIGR